MKQLDPKKTDMKKIRETYEKTYGQIYEKNMFFFFFPSKKKNVFFHKIFLFFIEKSYVSHKHMIN